MSSSSRFIDKLHSFARGIGQTIKKLFSALSDSIKYFLLFIWAIFKLFIIAVGKSLKTIFEEFYYIVVSVARVVFQFIKAPFEYIIAPLFKLLFELIDELGEKAQERTDVALITTIVFIPVCIASSFACWGVVSLVEKSNMLPDGREATQNVWTSANSNIEKISPGDENKIERHKNEEKNIEFQIAKLSFSWNEMGNGLLRILLTAVFAIVAIAIGIGVFAAFASLLEDEEHPVVIGITAVVGILLFVAWLHIAYLIEPGNEGASILGLSASPFLGFLLRMLCVVIVLPAVLVFIGVIADPNIDRKPFRTILFISLLVLVWFFAALKLSFAPSAFYLDRL